MSGPQVGDVVTTAEELDALPEGSILIDQEGDVYYPDDIPWLRLPATLIYFPGQPPRPERVVKAEALREAAAGVWNDADRIEAGDLL
jgi:hypothetical protein